MSANQKIPKGPLAIAVFFILLFFIEVIVVTTATPDMPPVFWAIGGTFLILGIIIYIYLYRKYKTGGYSTTTVSGEAITPSITPDISDKILFRSNLIVGIVIVILASMLFGLANAPFTDRLSRISYIATGVILLFGAILNFIIYGIKPEKARQKRLEKIAKKEAKKGN